VENTSKILIVDDAEDTVELLKKRFRAEGYDTAEAYNGEEALKKVPEYDPDLIVLDIMMPKIDGYEVCQRLKADEKTRYIPILMLTAKGEVEHKVKGLDIGADDYMAKPFDYKELSARIRSLLSIKATHQKKVEEEKSGALEQMMELLQSERDPGQSSPFQAIFLFPSAPTLPLDLIGLTVTSLEADTGTTKFDLGLSMTDTGGALTGTVTYKTDLFDSATIAQILRNFEMLLESIVCDPDQHIA